MNMGHRRKTDSLSPPPGGVRWVVWRLQRIHQAIQAGQFPNATTLAREIEVSTKTIHRDLEFMRDRLALPIRYAGDRFGYEYTQKVSLCPLCAGRKHRKVK